MANQEKSEVAIDRISDLPDHILCHILSFLGIKRAVRTSILAPRWRYLFFSMSELDFDFNCPAEENIENFKNFLDRLLFSPQHLNLQRFNMPNYVLDHDYSSRLYGWLCAMLWRGVKEIGLEASNGLVLPTLLFTSRSLVTLELDIEGEMKVPANVCLPNLKTLHLTSIEFSDGGSFQRLVSNCIVLEELSIVGICLTNIDKLCIQSPSLKKLEIYHYEDVGYSSSTMNSLEQACIDISNFYHVSGLTHLFQAICNVQSLELVIGLDEDEDEDEEVSVLVTVLNSNLNSLPAFDNLVVFEFKFFGDDQLLWLMGFLHHMPYLKNLMLYLGEGQVEDYESLPKQVPSCLLFHLKEIVLYPYYDGPICSFDVIKFFLNHALILEKLMIKARIPEEEQRLSILEELLRFPRNSKQCQIEISRR